MPVRYWFPPGTAATISINGGEFKPFKTNELMSFEQPAAVSPDELTFDGERFQICVAKSLVYRFEWDGSGGHNQPCG